MTQQLRQAETPQAQALPAGGPQAKARIATILLDRAAGSQASITAIAVLYRLVCDTWWNAKLGSWAVEASHEKIAIRLGSVVCPRTVKRAVDELLSIGVIVLRRGSGRQPTLYILQEGCHQCHPRGDTHVTPGVTPVSPPFSVLVQDQNTAAALRSDRFAPTTKPSPSRPRQDAAAAASLFASQETPAEPSPAPLRLAEIDEAELRGRVAWLSVRPNWLADDQGWILPSAIAPLASRARSIAELHAAIVQGWQSRTRLRNPVYPIIAAIEQHLLRGEAETLEAKLAEALWRARQGERAIAERGIRDTAAIAKMRLEHDPHALLAREDAFYKAAGATVPGFTPGDQSDIKPAAASAIAPVAALGGTDAQGAAIAPACPGRPEGPLGSLYDLAGAVRFDRDLRAAVRIDAGAMVLLGSPAAQEVLMKRYGQQLAAVAAEHGLSFTPPQNRTAASPLAIAAARDQAAAMRRMQEHRS